MERRSDGGEAVVQGICFGGSLELAIRTDPIIAAGTDLFGHPEQTLDRAAYLLVNPYSELLPGSGKDLRILSSTNLLFTPIGVSL